MDLFDHMCDQRRMHKDDEPSKHLELEISETNRRRLKEHKIAQLEAKRKILNSGFNGNKKIRAAQRKLDGVGNIKNHCAIVNDERALEKLKNKQMMIDGIAQIEEANRKASSNKVQQAKEDLEKIAPAAKAKLLEKKVVNTLTKAQIIAVLSVYFGRLADAKKLKPSLVMDLENEIAARPAVLGVTLKAKAPPMAAMPPAEATDVEQGLLDAMAVPGSEDSPSRTEVL